MLKAVHSGALALGVYRWRKCGVVVRLKIAPARVRIYDKLALLEAGGCIVGITIVRIDELAVRYSAFHL